MGITRSFEIERLKSELAARIERTASLAATSHLGEMVRQGHCSAEVFVSQRIAAACIGMSRAA
jgi:hypothetical protein